MKDASVTTNMCFLMTGSPTVEENHIKEMKPQKIKVKIFNNEVIIYKNGDLTSGKIDTFGTNYYEVLDDIMSTDFWSEEIIKEAIKADVIKNIELTSAINASGKKGYILEAILSFNKNSNFYKIWNDERKKKGEAFLISIANM